MAQDSTAPIFSRDHRDTRSLDRARDVVEYLQKNPDEPILVQEVATHIASYYDEVLHVITTLEALGMVQRYRRDGSPREGGRIAYAWVQPSKKDNKKTRDQFRKVNSGG